MGKQLEFNWGGHWAFPANYKKPKFNSQKPLKKIEMYKIPHYPTTSLNSIETFEGETLEQKIDRILTHKEPIKDEGVALIYSERKKGVLPETNVRTDRWEIATDAMDKVAGSKIAKRKEFEIIEGGKTEGLQTASGMAENS